MTVAELLSAVVIPSIFRSVYSPGALRQGEGPGADGRNPFDIQVSLFGVTTGASRSAPGLLS